MNKNNKSTTSNFLLEENFERINTQNYAFPVDALFATDKFIIHPYFQRHYVWNTKKASYLIETILSGIPIPPIYTYREENGREVVIDGQQRLTSIKKFINNEFRFEPNTLFDYLEGFYFDDLPDDYKQRILYNNIFVVSFNGLISKERIFDIFKRYNTGGVALNNQEIRNCIYSGPFNDLIKELSNYSPYVELIASKDIDRMEKENNVLRFLALHENLDVYNGKINEFLDKYLDEKLALYPEDNDEFKKMHHALKKIFLNSLDLCQHVFGDDAFKNCLDFSTSKGKKTIMYKTFSKPVFDMQMLGFSKFDFAKIYRNAAAIKAKYEEALKTDEKIRPYYKKMSRKAVLYRVNTWREYIRSIIE